MPHPTISRKFSNRLRVAAFGPAVKYLLEFIKTSTKTRLKSSLFFMEACLNILPKYIQKTLKNQFKNDQKINFFF